MKMKMKMKLQMKTQMKKWKNNFKHFQSVARCESYNITPYMPLDNPHAWCFCFYFEVIPSNIAMHTISKNNARHCAGLKNSDSNCLHFHFYFATCRFLALRHVHWLTVNRISGQRCLALGLDEALVTTLIDSGINTISKYAFSSSYVPGMTDLDTIYKCHSNSDGPGTYSWWTCKPQKTFSWMLRLDSFRVEGPCRTCWGRTCQEISTARKSRSTGETTEEAHWNQNSW